MVSEFLLETAKEQFGYVLAVVFDRWPVTNFKIVEDFKPIPSE